MVYSSVSVWISLLSEGAYSPHLTFQNSSLGLVFLLISNNTKLNGVLTTLYYITVMYYH